MFTKDAWPFIPTKLSEIIDKDTLSVIETGCCERLQKPMTLLDFNWQTAQSSRIDSINHGQYLQPFCKLLRDPTRVRGGNDACERCDRKQAQNAYELREREPYRRYPCYMGVLDTSHTIEVCGWVVAILFAGQCRPDRGSQKIQRNVQSLGRDRFEHIQPLDSTVQAELIALAEGLPPLPQQFGIQMRHEAEHIQRIAEAKYQNQKSLWQQEFLDTLRTMISTFDENLDLECLQKQTHLLLKSIQTFCRCQYVTFFASTREGDTVLPLIAEVGLSASPRTYLPHFNWKKAGLSIQGSSMEGRSATQIQAVIQRGVRGENSTLFSQADCMFPTTLGKNYRGVVVFGPFAEKIRLEQEQRFLQDISNIIGLFVLPELQVFYLQQKQRGWESTAKLLTHQLRTALTPIATHVGSAHLLMQSPSYANFSNQIIESLKRAEELCIRLSKTSQETLESHALLLERDDLELEQYPFSVLIGNCVQDFMNEAENRHRRLHVDKKIELLPEAEVDVARLAIAISNLIENALKYSYTNTQIYVRGSTNNVWDQSQATAQIEIDNLGHEIRPEDQRRIFERGARGLIRAKMGKIPGTGLGLWEARAVIEAHGGRITLKSEPTSIYRRRIQAHRVVFTVEIPLKQS